jgi:2'-5' RNA ligase
MGGCDGAGELVNSFALVSYLSDPLLKFLDRLRAELVHECVGKAHLTFLPPRPLVCSPEEACKELNARLREFQPFRVELAEVEVFQATQVIYLSLRTGGAEANRLHGVLNVGCLHFAEPFPYHPHVTLGRDIQPEDLAAAVELAARRWREFPNRRDFTVDQLVFVQNTLDNRWTDIAGCALDHSNIPI